MQLTLNKSYEQRLEDCHKKRREGYPPLTDLADALYWKAQGNELPMADYLAKVTEVKARVPKPTE